VTFHARGLSPEEVAQAVRDSTGESTPRSTRLAAASRSTSPSIHSPSTDGMSRWGWPRRS